MAPEFEQIRVSWQLDVPENGTQPILKSRE
jgi:hypothetical protein